MKNVMGVIYTGENDAKLRELTLTRAIAALPVGGRYRVIDFLLSSMVNGGIKNVGVITQKNYSSLMDHIGSGREWDLHGKQGLVMLPPFLTRENMGVYSGLLDALKSNSTYLRLSRQEYIVLTNSHTIYNMDYTDALKYHVEKGADVTVRAKIFPDLDAIRDSLHGSVPTKEQIAEAVRRAVAEINEKLPSYKRIRSYKIRESAFEKTTTQKIKRFGDNMKDE